MNKRGRDRGKFNYYGQMKWRPPIHKQFNQKEHDDRDSSVLAGFHQRRVSFKGHGREGRRNRQSGWDQKLRNAFLLDSDDVDMNGPNGRGVSVTRVSPYHVNRGNYRGRGPPRHSRDSPVPGSRNKVLQESASNWYKVLIPNGAKHDREYLLRILLGYIRPYTFVPFGYKRSGEDVIFYTDEYSVAEQLMAADRKITANDGHKIRLQVRPNMPFIEVDDKLKEKVKVIMSKRYLIETQALDLRKFHVDPDFIAEDIFFPLNRPNLLSTVIQIICDMIPEIRALDLSENRINSVDILKPLVEKAPQLKVLHLANSRIRFVNQFDCLQGLPLEDLNIDGNPVCDKFKDQSAYVREVRKRFPKVIKLDGTDLPPPIVFDVEDDTRLMPSRGSFLCDVNGGNVARGFIEQYYTIFDSDSRQPLIDAYHENAQFSLTCTPGLSSYIPDSRNLLAVSHLDKRVRLLRQGRSSVIAFLTSLIKTQHDPASFAVDLLLCNPQLIYLSINGVFREPSSNKKLPIRSFSRVFIIVPGAESGFCIVNDMFSITNASPDQAKEAFKLPVVQTPAPVPTQPSPQVIVPPVVVAPAPVISSPPGCVPLVSNVNIEAQQQMVATLALQTGMNLAWSEKCLNETSWNFDNALFVFSELNKQGKVPTEAFIK